MRPTSDEYARRARDRKTRLLARVLADTTIDDPADLLTAPDLVWELAALLATERTKPGPHTPPQTVIPTPPAGSRSAVVDVVRWVRDEREHPDPFTPRVVR